MGSVCSGRTEVGFAEGPIKLSNEIQVTSKSDLKFTSGMFITENQKEFNEVYSLHTKPLGSGAYGEVYLCNHKITNDLRAVKILLKEHISQEEIDSRSVFIEVEILKTLDHPNILKVYEYFEDPEKYYIVMEYCRGGDLFQKIEDRGTFTEAMTGKVAKQLLSALTYLHSKKIIHRDIKPENILLCDKNDTNEMSLKLIDFNIATIKKAKLQAKGTLDYMAPEAFKGDYDERCDIWSAGVILYALIAGGLPFGGADEDKIKSNILNSKPDLETGPWRSVSNQCKDLLSRLLEKNPAIRITADQALKHVWILRFLDSDFDTAEYNKAITKMKTLSKSSKLKEAVTTFMVSQLSRTDSSISKLQHVFDRLDSNKDGVISADELLEELRKELPQAEAEAEVKKIIESVDMDRSGNIGYTEFLRVNMEESSLLSAENVRKAFAYLDKDGSGTIEQPELIAWFSTGKAIPAEIIQELMEEADKDGDGKIDIVEFENMLLEKLDLINEEGEEEVE